ncbi:MAG: sugar transferase, partial [Candidatus Magasanikbacteria bacterium]|nr:sugar transferase [Candidatus Magasanikbacteria bacterium]
YQTRQPAVFTIKPGVTGLAQISGRSDLSFAEEMRLNLLYVEEWSLLLDLIIIVKTPFAVFRRRAVV